jgi:carbon-monoxide dehydrogenase small subunit
MSTTVVLNVNGVEHAGDTEPRKTLVDFLREDLGLTGTHVGCEHGVCGACTVLLDGEPVRSCLMLAVQASGHEISTIEGLGDPENLNPLQAALRQSHGFQCGFCTPGFLMTATALLRDDPGIGEEELRAELSGNICRCTGYQSIIEGILLAAGTLADGHKEAMEQHGGVG